MTNELGVYEIINRQAEDGASAFILDLRNSTKITRNISWDNRLVDYINFLMNTKQQFLEYIINNVNPHEWAFNDTGDGLLCVFWDDFHTVTCLKAFLVLKKILDKELKTINDKLSAEPKLSSGFALHSGGCSIFRSRLNFDDKIIERDFICGILPNTVARLEALNKQFINNKTVASGNFRKTFRIQTKLRNSGYMNLFDEKINFIEKVPMRMQINDAKIKGHVIYLVKDSFFQHANQLIA